VGQLDVAMVKGCGDVRSSYRKAEKEEGTKIKERREARERADREGSGPGKASII